VREAARGCWPCSVPSNWRSRGASQPTSTSSSTKCSGVSSPLDRADKLPIYASAGVGHAWLVDRLAQTLEVYKQEAGRWLLLDASKADARVRAEPFEAVEFDLGALWAR
jgi:Putative restriction endonuclease